MNVILMFAQEYYALGLYNKADIADFVKWNDITSQDYQDITGEQYEASTENSK